ncbi:ATP-dependent RNA helicase dbp4 [Ascosphaera atra]|nr:ATP-dependent RNA helicase dbp4 [Ascosphaera atra]
MISERELKRKRQELDLSALRKKVVNLETAKPVKRFAELPLSEATAAGLSDSHYKTLTDIQAKALPLALKGCDILGAAKTGSGKTLAFLIPVLESLYREKWTAHDGLGALILSPTRELALQIFEVLREVGRYHTFSAGLVVGGKKLQDERERLSRMNILICTPGRMLQHMDQTAAFETSNLRVLVLDEADRIMDMGFRSTVDAILEHLPKDRQTMLFSATQTNNVSDLARLSLHEPSYIAVHESATFSTPTNLQQNYIVTPLPEKLDTLWSFVRGNLKSKTIVFFSSGKQVRFVYEAFRHLRPGVPLLHLHGRQKLGTRIDSMRRFSSSMHCCLFATDIAARGLDFPAVDWVIQVDCPEDADTYIHRVGRTARYERNGRAVLFLEPSEEEGMVRLLESRNVPIERIGVRSKRKQSVKSQLQSMCFKDLSLKHLGQKAFISYVKSVHVQKNKDIFDVKALPLEDFAAAIGLPGAPRVRFIDGDDAKQLKNRPRALPMILAGVENCTSPGSEAKTDEKEVRTRYDRMFKRKNQDVLTDHYSKLVDGNKAENLIGRGDNPDAEDVEEDFLHVKRRFHAGDEALGKMASFEDDASREYFGPASAGARAIYFAGAAPFVVDSKRREKELRSKKKLLKYKSVGKRIVFDEEGISREIYRLEKEDEFRGRGDIEAQRAKFLEIEAERQRLADTRDKEVAKQKKRERKEKRKAMLKETERGLQETQGGVTHASDIYGARAVQNVRRRDSESAEGSAVIKPRKKQKISEQRATRPNNLTIEELENLTSRFLH